MSETRFPAKLILTSPKDFFKPSAGGSSPKQFGPVTPDVRNILRAQVSSVAKPFEAAFRTHPRTSAVARVTLKKAALAKSHRPTALLDKVDCPIIGIDRLGDLLVSVRPTSLRALMETIAHERSQRGVANISTIEQILPYTFSSAHLRSIQSGLRATPGTPVKLRLFRHPEHEVNNQLESAFSAELRKRNIKGTRLNYGSTITVFMLNGVEPDQVDDLASLASIQSIDFFPEYHVARSSVVPVGAADPALFSLPLPGLEYPMVGVIDSGIDPSNSLLSPWIADRYSYVPEVDIDTTHGTFVAGLIVYPRALNHQDARFPAMPCKLVDIVAVPRSGSLPEYQLLEIIRESVERYPTVRVWNLSMEGAVPCSDHVFSEFAIALDEIQTDHNVNFVVAAGNYNAAPFRPWPPDGAAGEEDRIRGPADSCRALTVGSFAHRDSAASRVAASSPSPFSRRGPGPVYLPKPEVAHFGGNCDHIGGHRQMGVLSFGPGGLIAESIGTSFAAPPVYEITANIREGLDSQLSTTLTRALVVHSAVLAGGDLTKDQLPYTGFGIPTDAEQSVTCPPWAATLIFELELEAGTDFQREQFPIPQCLRFESGFRGELTATLAYDPILDGSKGAEYCRSNIDLSLGLYDAGPDGSRKHQGQLRPYPTGRFPANWERERIEQGHKWSPIKVYRRVCPKGVSGTNWRMLLDATDRSGTQNGPVRVGLVVTIADIERKRPVYNEVAVLLKSAGWVANDVQLRARDRAR